MNWRDFRHVHRDPCCEDLGPLVFDRPESEAALSRPATGDRRRSSHRDRVREERAAKVKGSAARLNGYLAFMEAFLLLGGILFLGAAGVSMVMALLRMFKGIAPSRGGSTVQARDQMRLRKLARSGTRVSQKDAAPVREIVEQQLDMRERSEAARPLMMRGLGLYTIGIVLFGLGGDQAVLPLLISVAVMGVLFSLRTFFTGWVTANTKPPQKRMAGPLTATRS